MEELIKSRSEVKQYCVYAHYYGEKLFYIGSGEVSRNSRGLNGRPFDFNGRNENWLFFCNGEKDKVKVEILFVTNDQKLSLDKEEEITRMYMEKGLSLANKNIGNRHSEERKKQHSITMSGENNPMYGMKHNEQARKKISEANKGKKISEEKQYCVYAHYYENQLFYIGSGEVSRNSRRLRGRPFVFNGRSLEWFKFCNWEKDKVKVEILFVTNDQKLSLDKEEEITRYYMELETPLVNVKIGNKMSEEQKKNFSGENNPTYGMKHTEEAKKKISEAQRGEKNNNWGKKGKDAPFYGKKHSEETKIKMSETRKGENHPMYGKTHSKESKKKMSLALSGENNPNYGKNHSAESRKKMSESKNGGKNPAAKRVLIINNETGEQISSPTIKGVYEFIVEKGFDKTKCTLQRRLKKGPFTFKNYKIELTK